MQRPADHTRKQGHVRKAGINHSAFHIRHVSLRNANSLGDVSLCQASREAGLFKIMGKNHQFYRFVFVRHPAFA